MKKMTLRDHRKKLNLSQSEMAKMLGITQPYLSQIENGLRKPSLEMALKISKELGVEPDIFFQSNIA